MSLEIPAANRHGGDGPAVARALGLDPASLLDLSQNLNPFAPNVAEMAAPHLRSVSHYPDPTAAAEMLAEAIGVDRDRFLLTNGGSEAIALVAAELGGQPKSEPDFALYPRQGTGPVWRSDPHNPSGTLAGSDEHADVWDEAFYPLATGQWSAGRRGVTVGSLTKVFACPGLRLGYVIADEVQRFGRRQAKWSVNSLAVAAIPDLIQHADLQSWRDQIKLARGKLVKVFTTHGFTVRAAEAPWVLVKAPGLREQLAPKGVLVRDCANFGLAGWVRVAVPDQAGLSRLEVALSEVGRIPAADNAEKGPVG